MDYGANISFTSQDEYYQSCMWFKKRYNKQGYPHTPEDIMMNEDHYFSKSFWFWIRLARN